MSHTRSVSDAVAVPVVRFVVDTVIGRPPDTSISNGRINESALKLHARKDHSLPLIIGTRSVVEAAIVPARRSVVDGVTTVTDQFSHFHGPHFMRRFGRRSAMISRRMSATPWNTPMIIMPSSVASELTAIPAER